MDFEGSVGLAGERVVSRQSKHISSATTAGQSGGEVVGMEGNG